MQYVIYAVAHVHIIILTFHLFDKFESHSYFVIENIAACIMNCIFDNASSLFIATSHYSCRMFMELYMGIGNARLCKRFAVYCCGLGHPSLRLYPPGCQATRSAQSQKQPSIVAEVEKHTENIYQHDFSIRTFLLLACRSCTLHMELQQRADTQACNWMVTTATLM